MGDAGAVTRKTRAEVENLVDEVVQTLQNGVTHPDGSDGFDAAEADRLRARLRSFADAVIGASRGRDPDALDGAIDDVVESIRSGVIAPTEHGGIGDSEAAELRNSLASYARAIVDAAHTGTRGEIDDAVRQVVRTIRSGLFSMFGRESVAAIRGDQLEAYLETFADAVLTVVERDSADPRRRGAAAT